MIGVLKTITKTLTRKIITNAQLSNLHLLKQLYDDAKPPLSGRIVEQRKPTVVNLNANDICNSKCAMCNIWEQKQDFEVTPEQLKFILQDPLYSEVKHVGITGGEPTLREDLPELYEAVIHAIPGLKGLSIITNAIKEKDVISRIEKVIEKVHHYNKDFNMMVSLDGYGDMHDKVRGRPGNFVTAVNVINHFQAKKIPLAIGCTISKVNVWDVEELLFFMKNNKIYGRFRVAEFIKRLYNDNKANVIRNFDEDEIYQLMLFFYKLIYTYETNETYINTYRSIINILNGGKRLVGCPYQGDGVVLNSRGELAYCAPKSSIIGNGLNESSNLIYDTNTDERRRILDQECDACIHDYHAPLTGAAYKESLSAHFWRNRLNIDSEGPLFSDRFIKPRRLVKKGIKQVLIVGWYGTETVGDKAILGGIVDQLDSLYQNNYQLVIASIFPFITERTCKELNLNANVIDAYSKELIAFSKGSDVVIMGGGPLMDLEDLAIPLRAFQYAKLEGNSTIIYGCGLGPLTKTRYINVVSEILKLADDIRLRDNKSIKLAKSSFRIEKEITLSGDPAKIYLSRYPDKQSDPKILRCYVREWTHEYAAEMTQDDFYLKKLSFEGALAAFIKRKALEIGAREIRFENMHNFVIGNDDRDFSRYFLDQYFKDWEDTLVSYDKYLATVDSIVKSMQNSSHNICMRFHSVVFAHTLKTSFTAVDYTMGGKINNYLSDNNCIEKLVNVDDLIANYND
ncbi:polysaccharide pyruvyl transferase family protein [Pedobacter frigiditerrae]|uniref:polysaccharide pyruvyl transferase family protein n=1 Tax=Pedobacter frigiditerrae TaxID=2530452 RepID=UPI00292E57A7|nr:polysaccharide pyruvyl transferase family protein [Pedobacter frigiditerrae]